MDCHHISAAAITLWTSVSGAANPIAVTALSESQAAVRTSIVWLGNLLASPQNPLIQSFVGQPVQASPGAGGDSTLKDNHLTV
jgi:hypothetical protein